MAGQAITISILADAARAQADMRRTGTTAVDMGRDAERASRSFHELGDGFGEGASRSSQLAGGLGDLGAGLALLPGPAGKVGGAMEALGPVIMAATGGFDLLEFASKTFRLGQIKNAAAMVGSKIAMVAGTVATGAMTAAQYALNLAMSLNPIGIVIAAIVALVAVFVIAYKKSETFRKIVNAAWAGIKTGALAVFNFLKTYFLAAFTFYKSVFLAGINAIKNIWAGIRFLYTKAVEIGSTVVAFFRALPGRLVAAVGSLVNSLRSKGSELIAGFRNGVTGAWSLVVSFVSGIGSKVKNAIGDVGSKLYSIGSDIVAGMRRGIENAWDGLLAKVRSLVDKIPKAVRDLLGISSPSRVMADLVGKPMAQGIAAGFAAALPSGRDLIRPLVADLSAAKVGVSVNTAGTSSASGSVINVTVNAGVGDPVEIGRQVVKTVRAYEQDKGRTVLVTRVGAFA